VRRLVEAEAVAESRGFLGIQMNYAPFACQTTNGRLNRLPEINRQLSNCRPHLAGAAARLGIEPGVLQRRYLFADTSVWKHF
jgi:hypothetical protein